MNRQGTTTGPGPTLCAEPVCVNPSFSSSSQPAVVVASAIDASDTDHARRLMCTDNLRSQAPANQCRLKGEQHGSNCVPGLHVNGASSRAPSSLLDAVSHRPGRRRSPVAPPEFEPPPRPDQPAATPGRRLAQRREGRAAHPSPTVSVKATLEAQYRHLKPHVQLAVLRYLSRSGTYHRPYLHLPGRSASTLAAGRRLRDRRDRVCLRPVPPLTY